MKIKIEHMQQVMLWVLTIVFVLILAGCGSQQAENNQNTQNNNQENTVVEETGDDEEEDSQLRVGIISTNTGAFTAYNSDILQGYSRVFESANLEGGVEERPIKIIEKQGACSGDFGREAAETLTKLDKVQVILGAGCGEAVQLAARVAQNNGVTMINLGAGLPDIAKSGDYVFNYWSDTIQSEAILQYLQQNNIGSIGLIYPATEHDYLLAEHIMEGFNGEVVVDQKYATTDPDFEVVGESIVDVINEFDKLIFFPPSEENFLDLANSLRSQSVWDPIRKRVIGNDLVATDNVLDELSERAEGIMGIRPVGLENRITERGTALLSDYESQADDSLVVFAADIASMVVEAAQDNGISSDAIQEYLQEITKGNTRNTYVQGFYFTSSGDGMGIPFALVTVENGEFVPVR